MTDVGGDRLSIVYVGDPNSVHVRRWADWFARRGHRIAILAAQGVDIGPGLPQGIEVLRFTAYNTQRIRPLGMILARRTIRRALREFARNGRPPDVLHAHYATIASWHAWLSGFHPYVVSVWGSDVLIDARATRRAGVYARLSLGGAALVTGGTQELVDAALEVGARPGRTALIHHGVETGRFTPGEAPGGLRDRLGLGGCRIVLSPRMINSLYNPAVVVEALAWLPSDVVVVMTRHNADLREMARIETLAEERGVADRLRIIATVPEAELPDYFRLADAVVSVPSSDGGPLSVAEALSAGRPVVATDLPAVREWLADIDPESLVPVGDPEATAAAIRRVLDRPPSETAERGARARQAIVARADRDHTMAEMERLYHLLASPRPRRRPQEVS